MNKILLLLFCGGFGLLVSMPLACDRSPSYPTPNPTPTPTTALSGSVTASNFMFSPSAVTIMHGGAVTFILGGGTHSLYIDDGSGTCAQNYSSWPQTITFPTAGTFSFHCQYHSGCGTASCSGCTGMVGQVVVQ